MTRRTIPQIRERLIEIGVERGIPEVIELAEETKRRYHGRKGRTTAHQVTDELAARVRVFAMANPNLNNREIGARFKIDGGRVSEILFGKRGEA
jgi:hypothetical protein